jgi:hypothetical protein
MPRLVARDDFSGLELVWKLHSHPNLYTVSIVEQDVEGGDRSTQLYGLLQMYIPEPT